MGRHILIIPSWYPEYEEDTRGIFIRNQVLALVDNGNRAGVLYPNVRSLRSLRPRSLFGGTFNYDFRLDHTIPTYYIHGWNWFPRTKLNIKLWYIVVRRLFIRYCDEWGVPDLIHAHCVFNAGALSLMLKKDFGVPFVITEHSSAFAEGLIGERFRHFVKKVLSGARASIVVSPDLGKVLSEFVGNNIEFNYIPNIIDTDFFTPGPPNSKYQIGKDDINFLSIASHTKVKRIDLLLLAFANAFKGGDGNNGTANLLQIGSGPLRKRHERLAQKLGIDDRVHFAGQLPQSDVREAIRSCDCVVLSSFYETFGVVLAEAMACGKPVIATNVGGPASFVNEKNGILVSFDDADALKEALVTMSKSHDKYDNREIREQCIRKFGKTVITKKIEDVYKKISD